MVLFANKGVKVFCALIYYNLLKQFKIITKYTIHCTVEMIIIYLHNFTPVTQNKILAGTYCGSTFVVALRTIVEN